MRIAVIDDTENERSRLAAYIEKDCENKRVVCTVEMYDCGEAFLSDFEPEKYDAAFIDIYMPGISGMETAQRIRSVDNKCLIIFCTTSVEHAVQSYRVRAFDYLLKPYSDEQLGDVLANCMRALKNISAFIEIKCGWETKKLMLDSIFFTDYYNHYVQIHTADDVVKTHMPFSDFAALLKDFPRFMCCYRNCIVNMDKISSIDDTDFILSSGERVPIARLNKNEVKSKYADYTFSKLNGGI